jgi:hypothetical protein
MKLRLTTASAACAVCAALLAPGARAQFLGTNPFDAPTVNQTLEPDDFLFQGPQPGAVVITEFMKDPNFVVDTRGEWIEVYNAQPWRVNIEGWTLSDDAGNTVTISNGGLGVRIRTHEYWCSATTAT